MQRAIFAMLLGLCPLAAAAQPPAPQDAPSSANADANAIPATASQRVFGRRATKRRGSMVGYIEDATVRSQIRLRFDSGYDIDSPDRAEFFYAKCGCYRDLVGSPALDPNAPGPGPGIVTGMNYQQLYFMGEYALSAHASVFAELPVRWLKPLEFIPGTGSFGNQSGLADIRAGAKLSLSSDDMHDVTVMVRGSFPTGDSTKGLGTDHGSVEPAILYHQNVGDRAAVEMQFGDWHPTSSSKGPLPGDGNFAGDIIYYGIGPSVDVYRSRSGVRFSPVVELVGWRVMRGYQTSTFASGGTGAAKGINIVNLKLGARTTMANGGSFYIGYGVGLTDSVWYDKILRLEYRAKL
jgi:hypothetical protein